MRWEQKTPTKYTHTYTYKHTSSRHSDIAVHNEIDKTENQKPNRRVAGYNTATVTLCGGSSSSVDGCDSGRAARGIHLASPHHTLDSRTPTSRHTYASIHMYSWVCVYILCKWWWNCSFCCCQNGNEKTHTQAQTHHSSSSSSDRHRKQSDKVKKSGCKLRDDANAISPWQWRRHVQIHAYILTPGHTCMATTALALVLCSLQWSNTCWNLIGNNYNTEWGCCCRYWGGASIKSVYLRIGAAAASAGALLWWWWKWKPCNYRFLFGALTALRIGGEGSVPESIQIRREGESESKIDDGAFTCTTKENNKYVNR